MQQKTFTIDARTIIHLGRESIKDHTTALLELVKNSYDADANVVEVEIYQKETYDRIRISDDGSGMTESVIDNNWLRIGFSEKRQVKLTPKSRRKTGEKGIGRLSTDRLGEVLEIKSISFNEETKQIESTGIIVNWELFNQDKQDLSKIPIDTIDEPVITLPALRKADTGTELIISKLRYNWTKENIESLYNELSFFLPPLSEIKDFEIYLKNDISPNFNGKITPPDFVKPEVELCLEYSGDSNLLKYTLNDKINIETPKEGKISWAELSQKVIDPLDIAFDKNELSCGPAIIKLLLYPRKKALAEGTNFSLAELREYVDKNLGVKIYRDNISVKPYGYSGSLIGNDWLGLADRHSRNPAGVDRPDYRVVANQLVGAVFVGRDSNPSLTDSAAREGLVENKAFFDLRALTLAGLSLLENHRYLIYQEQKEKKRKLVFRPSPSETAEKFSEEVKFAKFGLDSLKKLTEDKVHLEDKHNKIQEAVEGLSKFIDESEKASYSFNELLNHNRVLAGLATIGIASAVFGHETQGAITEFRESAILANEYLTLDTPDIPTAIDELNKSIKYGSQVAAWGKFALSRVQREKRKKEKRIIKEIVENLIKELSGVFSSVDISIVQDHSEDFKAEVYSMDIESIMVNLLTNAYTACLQNSENRIIKIGIQEVKQNEENGFSIIVSNSGPPINPQFIDWIWEPLNSLKRDQQGKETGTGLGLSIVKSIVDDLKGTKNVFIDEELGGAKFRVWLPLK